MSKVRWGILSTAKIGVAQVIPAMQQSDICEITAIASRNMESAASASEELGIEKAYGSYDELLADPEIDAIYNPLPNHMHVEWSIKALEAGKHVLCEKPIGLSSEEAQELIDAGKEHPKLKLMEAFMFRHNLQWLKAKEIVQNGGIGKLLTIQSAFSYYNVDGDNIRNKAEIGGGGLMDIGCYPISVARFIFDSEPEKVMGLVEFDPKFKTDKMASAILDFGNGTATFTCSTQMVRYQRVNIFGERGRVEIEIPFNAPNAQPCKIWHQTESGTELIELETCDQYTLQGDHFSEAIINDTPVPTPIKDAKQNMQVIEAIFKSAASKGWEDV